MGCRRERSRKKICGMQEGEVKVHDLWDAGEREGTVREEGEKEWKEKDEHKVQSCRILGQMNQILF